MSISKQNIIGAGIGIVIIIASLVMFLLKVPIMDSKTFYFICGVAIIIMSLPFFSHLLLEGKKRERKRSNVLGVC
jgi:Kef-type K+ transport system membrane component KefB